jgi:hypothetical protein
MSVAWRVMSVMQRKGEVRTQRAKKKYEKVTHFLANTQGRDRYVYRNEETERYARPGKCGVGWGYQNTRKK